MKIFYLESYREEITALIFFQGTKVKVEVKIEEDGTHNPDRLLFHIRTNLPIDKGEPEALESYDYLNDMSNRQIDDFDDVNEGEKGMENICYLIEGSFCCLFFFVKHQKNLMP